MLAIDTETTGLDIYHGVKPFFVTICTDQEEVYFWEWPVNPLTRQPKVPESDLDDIAHLLSKADWIVGQNIKFDVGALSRLRSSFSKEWRWNVTRDTLVAEHLLNSNKPKSLTALALRYLGLDILVYEDRLVHSVKQARSTCRLKVNQEKLSEWRIAKKGDPDMPSCKESTHSYDYWLPKALAREGIFHPSDLWEGDYRRHHWNSVLREYANKDSEITLLVWMAQKTLIEKRGLEKLYEARMKVIPVALQMEQRGVTVSGGHLEELVRSYSLKSKEASNICTHIASGCLHRCQLCHGRKEILTLDSSLSSSKKEKNENNKVLSVKNDILISAIESAKLGIDTPVDVVADWYEEQGDLRTANRIRKGRREACPRCLGQGKALYELVLPRAASSKNLREFCFEVLNLEKVYKPDAKTSEPTLDSKNAIPRYLETLKPRTRERVFIEHLATKRSLDTAIAFMRSYQRFWLPLRSSSSRYLDWFTLHPILNPTGTDTLRWSSKSPNEQNISKKENFNLRYCFGPAPGREWYSFDGKNLELRIPSYESGEEDMIALFERPDDPPYYGSNHLLNFHTVYTDIWDQALSSAVWEWKGEHKGKRIDDTLVGPYCKKKFGSTWYQWIKNTWFGLQYNCGKRKADSTAHKDGAYDLIYGRLKKIGALNKKYIQQAERLGYVETLPDKSIDPSRGYPLLCTRTDSGGILSTVPFSYHIQGSATWWIMRVMQKVHDFFEQLNNGGLFQGKQWPGGYYLTLQVHDEIVVDAPDGIDTQYLSKGLTPPKSVEERPYEYNLPIMREVQRLMASCGEDLGVPTPAGCEYHQETYSEGITL